MGSRARRTLPTIWVHMWTVSRVSCHADMVSSGHASPAAPLTRPPSVRRGIVGHQREHPVLAALAPQDRWPQVARLGREDVLGPSRLSDPRRLSHLPFELAGPPAGVAGENPCPDDAL